jgi:hypothetical protein
VFLNDISYIDFTLDKRMKNYMINRMGGSPASNELAVASPKKN